MPVLFWTDALVFVLLAAVLSFVIYARRHEHLRAPWRRVLETPASMAALVIIGTYGIIGVLDSLHFHPKEEGSDGEVRYANRVESVLDIVLGPLAEQKERSYSAPLATRLLAKETVEKPDGSRVREYPRLQYGGAYLDDPAQASADIARLTAIGALGGLLAWALFAALLVWFISKSHGHDWRGVARRLIRGETVVCWRAMLITLGLVLVIIGILAALAGNYHVLGTDKVGEDVLYQAIKSIRTGLVIGTLTTLVMLPFAIFLGVAAGFFRGWVDDVIQYIYTTLNSIPSVLLIAAAVLMLLVFMNNNPEAFPSSEHRADMRLLFLCLILGITSWTGLCRLLRGEALKLREVEFVQAAQAFGVSRLRIISRHLVPNVMHIVLITVVLDFSGLVLAEAVLAYVEIGVDPTTYSWGNMINSARLELAREPVVWWSLVAAFIFMFVLVLFANLLADVVRDSLDPRLRHAR